MRLDNFNVQEPGLAMHVTVTFAGLYTVCFWLLIQVLQGTIRIGNESETSVADAESRVHGYPNLWVGSNGCLPDATASNPTRTSVRIFTIDYSALILYST